MPFTKLVPATRAYLERWNREAQSAGVKPLEAHEPHLFNYSSKPVLLKPFQHADATSVATSAIHLLADWARATEPGLSRSFRHSYLANSDAWNLAASAPPVTASCSLTCRSLFSDTADVVARRF
jgi:hypothetical protein